MEPVIVIIGIAVVLALVMKRFGGGTSSRRSGRSGGMAGDGGDGGDGGNGGGGGD